MSAIPLGTDLSTVPLYPPPDGLTSNFIDPPTLAPVVTAVCSILIAFEVFFVAVRVSSNLRPGRKVPLDDICAVVATFLTFGFMFCLLYLRPVARHFWDVSITQYNSSRVKVTFVEEMILGPTLFASKSSLMLLYYRVFSHNKYMRLYIYGGLIFSGATLLIMVPIDAALCAPRIGHPWQIQQSCTKTLAYGLLQGPANVIIDFFLLILPLRPILELQLPLRKKLGVLTIIMTGLLAITASIVGLVYRVHMYKSTDLGWSSSVVTICAFVESSISIICSSMPAMATFSKLHLAQVLSLASLRSRLWSNSELSARKNTSLSGSQGSKYQKSDPLSCETGSSSQLYSNGYVELNEYGKSQVTTEIKGDPSRSQLDHAGIEKSVRVEQSADVISDIERR